MVGIFTKAAFRPKPFKAAAYGKQGSGKTLTGLLWMEGFAGLRNGRVAVVDTDPGSGVMPYLAANKKRTVHPGAFDIDLLSTRSISDVLEAVLKLDTKVTTSIMLDSVTHLWEATREAWEARNPGKQATPSDWGKMKKPYKRLMKLLMESPCDVLILGKEKTLFGSDEGQSFVPMGVAMRADNDTPHDPDIYLHFFARGEPGSTKDTQPIAFFGEKDRYSILQGRTFENPTFDTLSPLLPFLGTEAPISEDDEERAQQDAELLDEGEKLRDRESKSQFHLADISARIAGVKTMDQLGEVSTEAKKRKRSMIETHIDAIRTLLASKAGEITNQKTGGV